MEDEIKRSSLSRTVNSSPRPAAPAFWSSILEDVAQGDVDHEETTAEATDCGCGYCLCWRRL